jgi:hypothetical protein
MKKIGRKLHKRNIVLLKFIKKHKDIYIYGAGLVCQKLILFLREEDIHISGIIVSNKSNNKGSLMGLKIYELSDITITKEVGIIIGVKVANQQEIFYSLKSAGIKEEHILPQNMFNILSPCQSIVDSIRDDTNTSSTFFKDYVDLNFLGYKQGTDKCSKYHNYLNKYEFFLKKWKEEKIILLEMGIYRAGSLYMWSEYFKNGLIYGIDIDETCKKYENENCKILIKDLADENSLDELSILNPDIIIDDASHWWSHQIKALYHLFPSLKRGGIYILEDLGTSFEPYKFSNFDDANITTYDFLSAISECVCSSNSLQMDNLNPNLVVFINEIEMIAEQIEMMCFIHESCIMIKK